MESTDEGNATFARIALAYEVLGHPQRRKRYDLSGELPQSDMALGRAAGETFLAEYVKSAPTVARTVTNKDMSLHSLENYEVLDVHGKDVPGYMSGIVMIGLGYLVGVVHNMEEKEVALLRHFVMDQMYALIAYTPPLDDEAFAERGYVITYYDHPLQSGIKPSWSDQNTLGGNKPLPEQVRCKEIDQVTMERRKLAALEWFGLPAKPDAEQVQDQVIAGEGTGPERLQLAVRALVQREPDPMSFDIHTLRRSLEKILCVDPHSLDSHSATGLMSLVLQAMDEMEDDCSEKEGLPVSGNVGPAEVDGTDRKAGYAEDTAAKANIKSSCTVGSRVLVLATGRVGDVVMHDPADASLTYKVKFTDGEDPETDWCSAHAVAPASEA